MEDRSPSARERTLTDAFVAIRDTAADAGTAVELGHASFTDLVRALSRIADWAAAALGDPGARAGQTDDT